MQFFHPQFRSFVQTSNQLTLVVTNAIVEPSLPVPEPSIAYTCRLFNGWFGVSFQISLLQTHIRAPHPSEILTLYNLTPLISLYPSFISLDQICNLVLHILPSCLSTHIADTFISYILPPPIPPPIIHQSLSSCVTLQPFAV